MAKISDIINIVESNSGHRLREDEGLKFGDPRADITGITVCWTASPEAIRSAAQHGHNVIICHEELTQPYPNFGSFVQRQYLGWPTNSQRLALLGKNGISALRIHGTLDELYICKAFCDQIGCTEIIAQDKNDIFCKLLSMEPTPYGRLIEQVKQAVQMNGIRATIGDPDRIIRTVGFLWGGMGLFVNVSYIESLIELGDVDLMIAGETDNYAMRFCKEIGIDVIETSHEISENRGLELFANKLPKQLPGIDVVFYENSCVWQMY